MSLSLSIILTCFIQAHSFKSSNDEMKLLPEHFPPFHTPSDSYNKHIPRNLWVAVKDEKDELPGHLKAFFERNSGWDVKICDNKCKDEFIDSVFAGTSVQWAYRMINPLVGAARADIWRYSVLFTYGGVYLDDDSDIKVPLDDIIKPNDRLLMSEEGSSSLGDCYLPEYHLSEDSTFERFKHNYTQAMHFDGYNPESKMPIFFHDHTLINWAIFIAPRHPILERTLRNIVEIVKSEYFRRSFVLMTRWDVKWKQVMCTTGFVLTYSVRELELEKNLPVEMFPKISVNNFREYGGNVKAIWTGGDSSHYMKSMQKKGGPQILHRYAPFKLDLILKYLEGRAVMGDAGREVFLVRNGMKSNFGDYETFLKLNFSDKRTKHVADFVLNQIPKGPVVTLQDPITKPNDMDKYPLENDDPGAGGSENPGTPHKKHNSHFHHAHHGKKWKNHHFMSSHIMSHFKTSDNWDERDFNSSDGGFSNSTWSMADLLNKQLLIKAMQGINNESMECFGDDYGGTRDDFIQDRWKHIISETPIMVHPVCLRMFQLGNTLGYFFNDIACADLTGAHFLGVHKHFELLFPETLFVKEKERQFTFFQYLPDLIVHPNPLPAAEVKSNMKSVCHCLQFCWENSDAPWLKRVNLIRQYLLPAIDAYVFAAGGFQIKTLLTKDTDLTNIPPEKVNSLPLIPNVTIQYRCGDNIGFGKTKYGLLPFSAFNPRRIPIKTSKFIYVIADSPQRNANHPYSHRCDKILQRLFEYLKKKFPTAVVVIKRGGDLFLDYARLAYSNVVICSASTFCLWPALANPFGESHFPLTPLIAKADSNESAPKLSPRFHWIGDVQMIKEFRNYRPWDRVIDDLESM